ncbi:MAG: hypothetical protein MR881_07315 [Bacteroidales bacterium]|nr:hypothetical protein [Bacteroidales bacterium]
MNIKHIFLLLLCACTLMPVQAQKAQDILDKTAGKLKNSGGIEAVFEATAFKGTKETGSAGGTIKVKGNKFKIESSSLTTWFDGKTQWTLLAGSDEVNVSTPTAAELQAINPYSFINIYKKGYAATLSKAAYEGKSVHEVRLVATSKNSNMPKILLTIDPSTLLPLSVRFKNAKGDWTRIRVRSIKTGRQFADTAFTFDAKQHPGIEVIDLR